MRRLARLLYALGLFCRYRLDQLLPRERLPTSLRLLLCIGPWHLFPTPSLARGERLRRCLEQLGPIPVKFGQLLSTRPDLLPEDIAQALAGLQDAVAPFPAEEAVRRIEEALQQPLSSAFRHFEREPMASASIAQVHAAIRHDGRSVVVKVIRPRIERTIAVDIALLLTLARGLERLWPDSRRLHPVTVVQDYQHTLDDELDMMKEAANTSQLRRNFPDSPLIYIPEVHWDLTRRPVLVMERIHGVPISDITTLRAEGVNLKRLAERGVEIFFTQVFRDSFFHADMHPGNIFVDIRNPADPRYIAIDCGIVGTLSPEDQSYLARNLLAFFRQDYRQVAELHVASGWIPAGTRVNEFEAAIRAVCEPIFNRPLKDISFGQFLVRLFQTARRFDMEVQPQLVLLQKTLLNVEGLGRQLYPELDLWSTGLPYLERWMRERIAPPGLLRAIGRHLPQWLEQAPEMPDLIYQTLDRLRQLERTPWPATGESADLETARTGRPQSTDHRRRRLRQAGLLLLGVAGLAASPGLQAWLMAQPPAVVVAGLLGLGLLLHSLG